MLVLLGEGDLVRLFGVPSRAFFLAVVVGFAVLAAPVVSAAVSVPDQAPDEATASVWAREAGKPVAGGKARGVSGDAVGARRVDQVGGRDAQRQRQVRAEPGEVGGRVGLGVDPVRAEYPGDQRDAISAGRGLRTWSRNK